jgi:hypothetical protein
MDFSDALRLVKKGHRLARAGWNGRSMFIFYAETAHATPAKTWPTGQVTYDPHIDLRTATGHFVPWLASQTDLLADDWETVRET